MAHNKTYNEQPALRVAAGFSKRYDTPEFQQALHASNKAFARTALLSALLLPPVVTLILSLFIRNNMGVLIGICIIMYIIGLPIAVFQLVKRNTGESWDGEVIDFIHRVSEEHADTYYIVCRGDDGKTRKVKDYVGHPMYTYFSSGDRVRFHPQLNVSLEKYDKTHDEYLLCPFCGSRQTLANDNCGKCGKPLLK